MKNDKDATEAAMLSIIWLIIFIAGLIIADEYNRAAGLLLIISTTITVIAVVYCDWRNEQTKKRLDNYIDDAGTRIKEVSEIGAEKLFENKIKAWLKEHDCWYIKYWAGSKFTKTGIPDLLCCVNGYFVAIEVKAQNGTPSELQEHTVKEIRNSGGFAVIAYPSGWNQLRSFLEDISHDVFDRDADLIFK